MASIQTFGCSFWPSCKTCDCGPPVVENKCVMCNRTYDCTEKREEYRCDDCMRKACGPYSHPSYD